MCVRQDRGRKLLLFNPRSHLQELCGVCVCTHVRVCYARTVTHHHPLILYHASQPMKMRCTVTETLPWLTTATKWYWTLNTLCLNTQFKAVVPSSGERMEAGVIKVNIINSNKKIVKTVIVNAKLDISKKDRNTYSWHNRLVLFWV